MTQREAALRGDYEKGLSDYFTTLKHYEFARTEKLKTELSRISGSNKRIERKLSALWESEKMRA